MVGTDGGRVRPRPPLVGSLAVVACALAGAYAAVLVVLLPAQVAALAPDDKVRALGFVSTLSFALTIAAQPLVGALSDRTRGRHGRRVPWAVGGALAAAVALLCLGEASSVAALAALWVVAQVALNALDVATSAVVPDEVPAPRRGRAYGLIGLGAVTGGAVAVLTVGRATDRPGTAYAAVALVVVLATAAFVVVDGRRRRAGDAAPPPVVAAQAPFWRGLLVDPRRERRFTEAFVSRLLFVLAYHLVYQYQLYVLTDHVGLPAPEAGRVVGVLTATAFGAILVSVLVTGWWSDRVGTRTPFLVGSCALLAAALLVPVAVPTVAGMAVFAVLKGLAFGAHVASGTALVTEVLPEGGASAGKDLGLYNVATNVPQTLAPALAAVVIAQLGGYAALFATASAVAVLALVVGVRLARGTRRPADDHADRVPVADATST
ncbi:MFS transporter [Cellulomonas sp. NPDC057328]|uniref:MFS transporter n=1 Tax=Cellulomonas sp. NPDC057328 TaxID=3346101 RepID=UPI003626A494